MKNKLITLTVIFVLSYVLPLSGNIGLLFSFQVILLALFCVILIMSQPAWSINEAEEQQSKDQHSIWVIALGCMACQIVSIAEWAYYRKPFHTFQLDDMATLGLCLMIGGTAFRVWCIRTLGEFFTSTVQAQAHHQIVRVGAYRFLRHPSYLGAYLSIVGSACMLHAYIGMVFSAMVMFGVYYYRIAVEEATLLRKFGEDYRLYQQHTDRIFPFIY